MAKRWIERLFSPVDVASLVALRIMFGTIILWEVCRYFMGGWIPGKFTEPTFHFTYYGFGWVHPWPGQGMFIHFAVLGAAAWFVAIGFLYRYAATVLFLAFTYVFLLEQAEYLNHFYLVCLISFLMIFVPANRAFSVDAWLRPRLRSATVPAWPILLMRAQMGLVYFYAGVAKLNGDWLHGEPLRMWLQNRDDLTMFGYQVGKLFHEEWMVYFVTYGGLLFDLLAFPLLVWRRTRPYIFAVALLFHLSNKVLFSIGIFPWLALSLTLTFFSPSWPRRLFGWVKGIARSPGGGRPPVETAAGRPAPAALTTAPSATWKRVTAWLIVAYFTVQILVPLRHFLYPGMVHWTEEGHRFSWHMKLRDKRAVASIRCIDPATGASWSVNLRKTLTGRQVDKMSGRPDMLLQFCHWVAEQERKNGREVAVHAIVYAGLNGRPAEPLVDKDVDLAKEKRNLLPAHWILPLTRPLREGDESEPIPADDD